MKDLAAKFAPQNFNDFLCLFVLGFIFTLWLFDGFGWIELNAEVLGASIAFFTIISQFYYRRAKSGKEEQPK